MKNFKRFFCFFLFGSFCFISFAKELEGENLVLVHRALNAKLIETCYENVDEKISFLKSELGEIEKAKVSSEAKLISEVLLKIEIETVKTSEALKVLRESEKGKKNRKKINQKDLNPDAESVIIGCFEKYKNFEANNKDLSSYFYFHYNETMYATVPYLKKNEQLKMMTGMLDDYKKLEEINPNLAETLNMYGAVLYFLPGAFGGNKKAGEEKIKKAIEVSACDYEKANALVLYGQLLVEKKEIDSAMNYVNQALEISPTNIYIQKIRDANKAGYSIFKMEEYEKTLEN
ncbi:MAG: hypothetical protein MJ182_04995 [Treponema sp.]|nr:hypothetical protein [Treponema sp.]